MQYLPWFVVCYCVKLHTYNLEEINQLNLRKGLPEYIYDSKHIQVVLVYGEVNMKNGSNTHSSYTVKQYNRTTKKEGTW